MGEPWDTLTVALNWTIWTAFVAEVVVMLRVVPDKGRWLRDHPLDVAIVLLTLRPSFALKSPMASHPSLAGRSSSAARVRAVRKVESPAAVLCGFAALAIAPAPEHIEIKRRSQIDLDGRDPVAHFTVPVALEACGQSLPRPCR